MSSAKQNMHILHEAACTSGPIQLSLQHELALTTQQDGKKWLFSEALTHRTTDVTYCSTQEEWAI